MLMLAMFAIEPVVCDDVMPKDTGTAVSPFRVTVFMFARYALPTDEHIPGSTAPI